MKKIIGQLRKSKFIGTVVHTLDHCLQRELKDCESVLDLGCGPSSPLKNCKNISYSVGVEAFEPYFKQAQKDQTHSEIINKKIEYLDFSPQSFDAVLMIEVLEHMPEPAGREILQKAEKWAKMKVVISSPNGFIAQKEVDDNPLQKHLSGWSYGKMKGLGYQSRGLAGLKFLRQEVQNGTMGDDFLTSIRFRPKIFWFAVATLSQMITYFIPTLAFGLFSVKKIK